jgi:hypothetical protein
MAARVVSTRCRGHGRDESVAPKLALADFLSIIPPSFTISPSRATAQLSLQHEQQPVPLLKLRTFRTTQDTCTAPTGLSHTPASGGAEHQVTLADDDCFAASRFARYSRSPSSTGLSASYLDSASESSFDLAFASLAVTFTAALAAK